MIRTVSASSLFMNFGGNFKIKNDENYRNFLRHALRRDEGTALITVANHRSIMDDPVLMANLVPYWYGIQPRFIRWNICTQNMCFQVGEAGRAKICNLSLSKNRNAKPASLFEIPFNLGPFNF